MKNIGSLLESVLYRVKGWVLDDVGYRHGGGQIPTVVRIGATKKIDSSTAIVINGALFGLDSSYTVPTGKVAILMIADINVPAVATDDDSIIQVFADTTAVKDIAVAQNSMERRIGYPVCREFIAGEVISFKGKNLTGGGDKTFNVEAWLLVTSS